MTVKELITKLLDCPMDSNIQFRTYKENGSFLYSTVRDSDVQVCSVFPDGNIYDDELVVIHIDPCEEGSEE